MQTPPCWVPGPVLGLGPGPGPRGCLYRFLTGFLHISNVFSGFGPPQKCFQDPSACFPGLRFLFFHEWGPCPRNQNQVQGSRVLDPGSWVLDPGAWSLDQGSRLGRSERIQELMILARANGYRIQGDDRQVLASRNPAPCLREPVLASRGQALAPGIGFHVGLGHNK